MRSRPAPSSSRIGTGTVLKTQEVSYGEDAEAPQAPSREGYTFTGWSSKDTNVTESRILMAQYERLSFTVRFVDYDGTELSSQSVFWGEAAAAPEAPAREGYTFTGWDADFSNIRKDLTVTAQSPLRAELRRRVRDGLVL